VAGRLPRLRGIVETGDEYEALIASSLPAPRRSRRETGTMLSYTGGTTGMPKGVVYTMSRLAGQALKTRAMVAGIALDDSASPVDAARRLHAGGTRPVCCPASPLMHSTAFTFVSLPVLAAGGAIVTLENRRFDAALLLAALERHAATVTAVVGDAFARPLVNALDERDAVGQPFDSRSLRVMCSAGVAFSADTKRRLFEHLPELTIVDACGATEGATYGVSVTRAGDDLSTVTFQPAPGTIVVDAQRRPVADGVVGYISALTVTSGYHRQPQKTGEAFYDVGDEHRVIPGDFGRIEPDGRLTLLGRGSTVINTGGEKVHPEEVEDVIKCVPGVVDVVVWRVPDERLGSVVGAVVQRLPGAALDEHGVRDHVRSRLAGYKAPRVVAFVDAIPRHANGKIDAARISDVLGASVSD
jgi:fatty-acyl-CoA synthase